MDETKLLATLTNMTRGLAALAVVTFGAGVWATTLQLRIDSLEEAAERVRPIEASLQRMDRNMILIGAKLGVDLERPRE